MFGNVLISLENSIHLVPLLFCYLGSSVTSLRLDRISKYSKVGNSDELKITANIGIFLLRANDNSV